MRPISYLSILLLCSAAEPHIVMSTPRVFSDHKVQTSPLGGEFLFPCQFGPAASYSFAQSLYVIAGSNISVSFLGSVVHGGGSCQMSLSKTASSDPTDWKVIHTVIGGCPATVDQLDGNLDTIGTSPDGYPIASSCSVSNQTNTNCLKAFSIQIPSAIAAGPYFFAWTWVSTSTVQRLKSKKYSSTRLATERCI